MIKLVSRATSVCADAYLTPAIRKYIDGFSSGFEGGLGTRSVKEETGARGARCEFMQSDGGLVDVEKFTGLKAILSGPAGGMSPIQNRQGQSKLTLNRRGRLCHHIV